MKSKCHVAALLALLGGSALVVAQAPEPQSPQAQTNPTPTFKAQVEFVEVDALVTDRQGQFVRGLTKDDFQVFEDGKRQTISTFALIDIPVERADRPLFAAQPIEPDVQTNERPFDGRVYVLMLDDLHVAPLRSKRVRTAARQFIERNMGANDLMAVVFTAGRAENAQEFTSNKRLLLAAVDHFMGQKIESPTLARNREYFQQQDDPLRDTVIPDPDEAQRVFNARSLLSSLTRVAEWFGGVHGRRKTLLLVSEGIDYDLSDIMRTSSAPASSAADIIQDIREAIGATARSNVSIYTVDPRGLAALGDDDIEVQSYANSDDPSVGIGLSSLNNELRMSQESLRQLADETGGFAAINRNDLASAFERIARDNSSYYVLAYYPPSEKRDGKFHKIEVRATRPGLTVRSRRGYASPRGKAAPVNTKTGGRSPELFDAINSPIQVSGLAMRVFAAPFKGASPNASVLVGVELRGRDLTLEGNAKVEVSFIAVDARAKVFGGRTDAFTMNLRPETRARVEQSGVRVLNRLELPPGRYQLRIAARDDVKDLRGSVVYDLEVPDFFKDPFGISGLALTSLGGGAMVTSKQDEQLKAVMPAPPIAERTFAQNDEIALFAEVYDNQSGSPHKVDVTTTVRTDEGRVLFKNEESRDSSEWQGAKGGFGYAARVPLSDIPPGSYVLTVEARSRLGESPTATRLVQIHIVPSAAAR